MKQNHKRAVGWVLLACLVSFLALDDLVTHVRLNRLRAFAAKAMWMLNQSAELLKEMAKRPEDDQP